MDEICHDFPLKPGSALCDVITYSVNNVIARANILAAVSQAKRANNL